MATASTSMRLSTPSVPDRLCAQDLPVLRVEEQLQAERARAGVVAGVAGRVDVDLLVAPPDPLQRPSRSGPGHADGEVEDLADGRALRLVVDAVAAEGVVGGDAALAVGRAGQRNQSTRCRRRSPSPPPRRRRRRCRGRWCACGRRPAMPPRSPSASPASCARLVSGRTPMARIARPHSTRLAGAQLRRSTAPAVGESS